MLNLIKDYAATRPTLVLKPSISEATSEDPLHQASSRRDKFAGLLHQVRGYECKRTLRRAGVCVAESVGAVWDHK